ncbi:hypothetical protein Q5P01_003555 [Channa striata]|uniref:Uncharacterized protein n=1 Tax=Channa striata TaxID=64152 RepID=A0AA88NSN3_CHASR|nr:hypothetical protein Q5P01_003555 [Channa striata]
MEKRRTCSRYIPRRLLLNPNGSSHLSINSEPRWNPTQFNSHIMFILPRTVQSISVATLSDQCLCGSCAT